MPNLAITVFIKDVAMPKNTEQYEKEVTANLLYWLNSDESGFANSENLAAAWLVDVGLGGYFWRLASKEERQAGSEELIEVNMQRPNHHPRARSTQAKGDLT